MSKKYEFSNDERYGVWKAHGERCFWRGEPIGFKLATMDQLIPELYASRRRELVHIIKRYSLPESFSINGFENWVPSHGICNSKKGGELFVAPPAMIAALARVQKLARKAELHGKRASSGVHTVSFSNMSQDEKTDWLLGRINEGTLSRSIQQKCLELARRQRASDRLDGLTAKPGSPDEYSDIKFRFSRHVCRRCGQVGNWDQSLCLDCGHLQRYVLILFGIPWRWPLLRRH
jgi:hypothetical protein